MTAERRRKRMEGDRFSNPRPGTPFIAIKTIGRSPVRPTIEKIAVPIYAGNDNGDGRMTNYRQAGTLNLTYMEYARLRDTLKAGSDVHPVSIGGINVNLIYLEPRPYRR